jgi:uncharacterized lipoprotein YajG
MAASKMPHTVAARRAALIVVESDPSLREILATTDDALKQALASQGYDVVVATSPEEARLLVKRYTFDKIYGDSTFLLDRAAGQQAASSGPTIEDLGNGTVRLQIDQVLPWSVAVELMDVLSESGADKPPRLS